MKSIVISQFHKGLKEFNHGYDTYGQYFELPHQSKFWFSTVNPLASSCFRGFSEKKSLNARGFARKYLRSCSGYRPSRSVKRRGKSSCLHSKKNFLLGKR